MEVLSSFLYLIVSKSSVALEMGQGVIRFRFF